MESLVIATNSSANSDVDVKCLEALQAPLAPCWLQPSFIIIGSVFQEATPPLSRHYTYACIAPRGCTLRACLCSLAKCQSFRSNPIAHAGHALLIGNGPGVMC